MNKCKPCDINRVCNPETKRCVLKTGKKGKEILSKTKNPGKPCDINRVYNPETKRCVLKTGKKGKEILSEKKNSVCHLSNIRRIETDENGFKFPVFKANLSLYKKHPCMSNINLELLFKDVCHIMNLEEQRITVRYKPEQKKVYGEELYDKWGCFQNICFDEDLNMEDIYNCKKRFVSINVTGEIGESCHRGTLLIDHRDKIVNVMNPHGSVSRFNPHFNKYAKYVSKELKYTFKSVTLSCSLKGVQYLEWIFQDYKINSKTPKHVKQFLNHLSNRDWNPDTRTGNCVVWSYLMIIAKLCNPELSNRRTQVLLEEYLNRDINNLVKISKIFMSLVVILDN